MPSPNLSRRDFLVRSSAALAAGMILPRYASAADANEKLILSAPLTHSDWMLKPNMAWGRDGVKHMLDACKACGWSRIHWRVFDAGRATYASKLLKPAGAADEDN